MEFDGPSDYYFWQGLELAQGSPLKAEEHPDLVFSFDNATTRAAIEAYRWGLCFGKVTTKEDFTENVVNRQDLKKSVDSFIKDMIDELSKDFDKPGIEGNC
jgi:hypothetical protein